MPTPEEDDDDSTSTTTPAILIITGGYYTPAAWTPFRARLEAAGFATACPALPTCGDATRPPHGTPALDADAVQGAARELIAARRRVLVLAHSYGGQVANDALAPELVARDARSPGVVALVYLAAFVPLRGQGLGDLVARHGFASAFALERDEYGVATLANPVEALYNDVDADAAAQLARGLVTWNFDLGAAVKVRYAPYEMLPCTYVRCRRDRAIFEEFAEGMVRDADAASGRPPMRAAWIDTGHAPMETASEDLLRVILKAWIN